MKKELNSFIEGYKFYKEKPSNTELICDFWPTIEDLNFKNDSLSKDYLNKQQYSGYYILKHLLEKYEK